MTKFSFLILLFLPLFIFPQDNKQLDSARVEQEIYWKGKVEIYKQAIILLIDSTRSSCQKIYKNDSLYISIDDYISSKLSSKYGKTNVYFSDSHFFKSPVKNGKLYVVKVSPVINLREDKLGIDFNLFVVSFENGDQNWLDSGGGDVTLYYNAKLKKYKLKDFNFTVYP
jgi:hypothetical protein